MSVGYNVTRIFIDIKLKSKDIEILKNYKRYILLQLL